MESLSKLYNSIATGVVVPALTGAEVLVTRFISIMYPSSVVTECVTQSYPRLSANLHVVAE